MIILSVLIPSIPSRSDLLVKLYNELDKQRKVIHDNWILGEVEILIDESKSFIEGGLSIGKKRESLVQRAQGRYLCFLDDDEQIAGNYLQTIVRLSESKADLLTFRSLANLDDYWCVVDMSLYNPTNEETSPDKICYRKPWHVCAVKSHLAKVHQFEDINYSEDWNWFEKVLTGCISEAHSDAVIHSYVHRAKVSEADKITEYELRTK